MPKTISCTSRQFGGSQRVILMFIRSDTFPKCYTEWYDPVTNLRENAPGINDCRRSAGLGVIRDKFVFSVGGICKSVFMLDVSSNVTEFVKRSISPSDCNVSDIIICAQVTSALHCLLQRKYVFLFRVSIVSHSRSVDQLSYMF
ncbi:uncharacterized protein LOC115033231 [Acyrthosiphon pisum]|uniref:Uncharacterized protein n=1 Tax=Acyrthosiphon pisum TaxID=7029 RepID=A0A8R2NJV3_ACYPI|nr:uncharacterized protein LOC115033231 [Acyrthosiphon pisum]